MGENKNIWGGRFSGKADPGFAEFNQSFDFDRRLLAADVRASIAHANALVGAAVLTKDEAGKINSALQTILEHGQADPGYFADLPSEDIHSFVEARLVEM